MTKMTVEDAVSQAQAVLMANLAERTASIRNVEGLAPAEVERFARKMQGDHERLEAKVVATIRAVYAGATPQEAARDAGLNVRRSWAEPAAPRSVA